jgi:hypothetical protein
MSDRPQKITLGDCRCPVMAPGRVPHHETQVGDRGACRMAVALVVVRGNCSACGSAGIDRPVTISQLIEVMPQPNAALVPTSPSGNDSPTANSESCRGYSCVGWSSKSLRGCSRSRRASRAISAISGSPSCSAFSIASSSNLASCARRSRSSRFLSISDALR